MQGIICCFGKEAGKADWGGKGEEGREVEGTNGSTDKLIAGLVNR